MRISAWRSPGLAPVTGAVNCSVTPLAVSPNEVNLCPVCYTGRADAGKGGIGQHLLKQPAVHGKSRPAVTGGEASRLPPDGAPNLL